MRWFLGQDMGQGREAVGVAEAWEAQEAWRAGVPAQQKGAGKGAGKA